MTTFRILPCVPLSMLLLACFEPAPSNGVEIDGSTSSSGTSADASSTAASAITSTTASSGPPVETGSSESGGEPLGSTSTGSSLSSDSGTTNSGDASTGIDDTSSSSGELEDTSRTVFLLPYAGAPMSYAGLSGADALCQAAADLAKLDGMYMAWLSTGPSEPVTDRFTEEGGPFVLVDGTEIALDWDDLTDGSIDAPILVDAQGLVYDATAVPERYVITHTNADATGAPGVIPCSGFTADSAIDARFGDAGAVDGAWTQTGDGWQCDSAISGGPSLYCFEQ